MTLAAFQTALADLTASPALCRQVRTKPETLRERYDLTAKEWRRLGGIATSKGSEANCMLSRANRLAPIALNRPETCTALGDDLNRLLSAYWDSEPITNVHFLIEAERFCRFLRALPALPSVARPSLEQAHALVAAQLAVTRKMARAARTDPWQLHRRRNK
jgi:hypothetical protein